MARAPARPRAGFAPGGGSSGSSVRGRRGWIAYLRGVWDELRKVIWPNWSELRRMTAVVVATVVVMGLLIGGADYLFAFISQPLILPGTNGAANTPIAPSQVTPTPAAAASPSSSPAANPSASPSP